MLTPAQRKAVIDADKRLADAMFGINAAVFILRMHGIDAPYLSTRRIEALRRDLKELLSMEAQGA